MTAQLERTWVSVCSYDQLVPERGVAALVDGEQVALFRTFDGMLHAIGNRDPFSGAFVLSRGIVGDKRGVPMIASPIYKNAFDLRTGQSLDDPAVQLRVWPLRVRDGRLEIEW